MKTNRKLLIALIAVLLVSVGLAVYAIRLKQTISTPSDDEEDYMILDTSDPTDQKTPDSSNKNKKDGETVEELIAAGQKNSDRSSSLQEDKILEDNIQRILNDSGGSWDVWTESLVSNTYSHNEAGSGSGRMVSASIIKLFIMGAVYQEVENGTITYASVQQDIRNMITISDNDAANRLIRRLGDGDPAAGMAKINQFAQSLGCRNTTINRLMLEENGLENYTSAEDCAKILRLIYRGQCVSRDLSSEMLTHLSLQEVNDRIPQGVPGGVTVAHKTGNLSNIANGDVGIVLLDDSPYIICVINNSAEGDGAINDKIVRISETAYNYYKIK